GGGAWLDRARSPGGVRELRCPPAVDGRGVDPDGGWERRGLGRPEYEALGMGGVGGRQDVGAVSANARGLAVMDHGRREQSDAAMPVRRVVPGEERLAEGPGGLEAAEPVGKVGP